MRNDRYRLGPLVVEIEGSDEDAVFRAVRGELSVLEAADADQVDLIFRFVDRFEEPEGAVHVGRWRLFDGGLIGRGGGYRFRMRGGEDGFRVDVTPTVKERALIDHYERAWDWNFLAPWETTAKNFMYDLFDLVSGAALVGRDASYLHASTCSREGQAVALVAWGGVGKTTSVLKLVTEDGWRFLSDDLGLVGADKTVWRTPRRLQIYAYNVEGQPSLRRRVLKGRGPVDRANWHWRLARFGNKRVRRRMSAEQLFGADSVATSATLSRAVFLERADVDRLEWSTVDFRKLANRSAAILVDELNTLFDVSLAAESHGIDVGIPSSTQLRRAYSKALEAAFESLPCERLRIPVDAGPDELMKTLRRRLNSQF